MRRTAMAVALAAWLAPAAARAEAAQDAGAAPAKPAWAFALYLDGYFPNGEQAYLVPTVFADRAPVHLEARYNYEDRETASFWVGWTFPFGGEKAYLKLTPMAGAVVGKVGGVAPGLEVEARWGRLAYWLEAEYLFDFAGSSGNYLYAWSELDLYLLPWIWVGASVQRLKLVETQTEVDAGPALGIGRQGSPGMSLTFYAYGLWRDVPWYLATLAVQF